MRATREVYLSLLDLIIPEIWTRYGRLPRLTFCTSVTSTLLGSSW